MGINNNSNIDETVRHDDSLLTASIACSLVSFIIGGIPLSIAALVLSIIGFVNFNRIVQASSNAAPQNAPMNYLANLKKKAILALVLSIAALVLNTISYILLLPVIFEYLQNPDSSSLMESLFGGTGSQALPGSNSTWG